MKEKGPKEREKITTHSYRGRLGNTQMKIHTERYKK